jgi:hypothetical protein
MLLENIVFPIKGLNHLGSSKHNVLSSFSNQRETIMAGAMLGKRKIDGEVCLEFLAGFW